MDHDHSYKLLFSYTEMVADLLRGFVREAWVEELDFDTLEKVNGSYVSDDLREREDDVIWRVRWGKEWLYVYLLLEFQSTVDRYMAVRMGTYVFLLYQDLVRAKELTADGLLPPVLPVVLYNGRPAWGAAQEVGELIVPAPRGLDRYRPALRYLLIDEGRYGESELAPLRNLAAALFRLEGSREPADVQRVLESLAEWLQAPEQSGLRRAFTVWLKRVFLPGRLPGLEFEQVRELQEVRAMLAERVVEWTEEWKRQGLEQGIEQGIEQGLARGRQSGEAEMLLRLLGRKFGAVPEEVRDRVLSADSEALLEWSERVLTASAIEEVFV